MAVWENDRVNAKPRYRRRARPTSRTGASRRARSSTVAAFTRGIATNFSTATGTRSACPAPSVTANFFDAMGVRPLLGDGFAPEPRRARTTPGAAS